MSKQPVTTAHNVRVANRTELARRLLEERNQDRVRRAGLLRADLEAIRDHGVAAAAHDRDQHAALAQQQSDFSRVDALRQKLETEEAALKARLPAVVLSLARDPATKHDAIFLDKLVFERYRIRALPAPEGDETAETKQERERVVRTDWFSRADSLGKLAETLLSRENLAQALTLRDFDRARIVALIANATELGKLNTNFVRTEHTELEAKAVIAQKAVWLACYRMIRSAVQGDIELEAIYAAC